MLRAGRANYILARSTNRLCRPDVDDLQVVGLRIGDDVRLGVARSGDHRFARLQGHTGPQVAPWLARADENGAGSIGILDNCHTHRNSAPSTFWDRCVEFAHPPGDDLRSVPQSWSGPRTFSRPDVLRPPRGNLAGRMFSCPGGNSSPSGPLFPLYKGFGIVPSPAGLPAPGTAPRNAFPIPGPAASPMTPATASSFSSPGLIRRAGPQRLTPRLHLAVKDDGAGVARCHAHPHDARDLQRRVFPLQRMHRATPVRRAPVLRPRRPVLRQPLVGLRHRLGRVHSQRPGLEEDQRRSWSSVSVRERYDGRATRTTPPSAACRFASKSIRA